MSLLRQTWVRARLQLCAACVGTALLGAAACGDDDDGDASGDDAGGARAGSEGSSGAGGAGGEASSDDCVKEPKTHLEIINACTDAEQVDKDPALPRLLADGGVPPLP